MIDREEMLSSAFAFEQETLPLFITPPNSEATLHLVGGFVQPKRYKEPRYSWAEHRSWIISNQNKTRDGYRGVSTGSEHQVYVVNTTHAETEMKERPYVCKSLYPFGGSYGDDKGLPLFHKGFICTGHRANSSSDTAWRPEGPKKTDCDERRNYERFAVKLYLFDQSRLRSGLVKNQYPAGAVNVVLTARVREDEVIGFKSKVRTNVLHGGSHCAYIREDVSFRTYEKDLGEWGVRLNPHLPEFPQSCGSKEELKDEMDYHHTIHLLVYRLITEGLK